MHDLNNFGLKGMVTCQNFLHQSGVNAESIERIQNILGEVKIDE